MSKPPTWTPAETAVLELVRRYRRIANPAGWPSANRAAAELHVTRQAITFEALREVPA